MKRFAFNLETLLRHRKNLEEKERVALSRIYSQLQNEVNRRNELLVKQNEVLAELSDKRSTGSDCEEMHWFYPYLKRLEVELGVCAKQIALLEETFEAQRRLVVQASQNRKVLDSLKSKKEKEFNTDIEKQEQKAIEELVTVKFSHKGTAG